MKNGTIAIIFGCILCGIFLTVRGNDGVKADYLLKGARDNGFIPAYRAYYSIKDETISKISKFKYDRYIYDDKKEYDYIPTTYYSFDVFAKNMNPSEWEYEQSKYNELIYNIDSLKTYLSEMQTGYWNMPSSLRGDKVNIFVTEFDDYTIVEATLVDYQNTIKDSKYAIFHNGNMLAAAKDLDLSSIRSVHRYKQ